MKLFHFVEHICIPFIPDPPDTHIDVLELVNSNFTTIIMLYMIVTAPVPFPKEYA